jgi:hypothetical protein
MIRGEVHEGVIRYDYLHQAWTERRGAGWVILPCGHGARVVDCYACAHVGERLEDASGVRSPSLVALGLDDSEAGAL